jgi:hypothetical protein
MSVLPGKILHRQLAYLQPERSRSLVLPQLTSVATAITTNGTADSGFQQRVDRSHPIDAEVHRIALAAFLNKFTRLRLASVGALHVCGSTPARFAT